MNDIKTIDLIKNKILEKLNELKTNFLNELDLSFIKNLDFKKEINKKINSYFDINEQEFSSIWNAKPIPEQFLLEQISNKNIYKICNFLYENNYINKKRFKHFLFNIKKNKSHLVRMVVKKIIEEILLNFCFFEYFKWFDNIKKIYFKQIKQRIDLIQKMVPAMETFSNLFGFFWDLSPAKLMNVDLENLQELAKQLNEKGFVKEIADLLGRLANSFNKYIDSYINEVTFKKSNKKTFYSPENITSIKYGNELQTILRYQLAYRRKEKWKVIFNSNYIEKKLLQLDQNAYGFDQIITNKKTESFDSNKGPFIMCVDTSLSMFGEPEKIAKALALAIIKIANQEKRKCYIITFSTKTKEFDATDVNKNIKKLINFLSMDFKGGTDIDEPLRIAINKVKENDYQNADIIVISDFIINHLSNWLISDINEIKKNNVRLHALTIGNFQIKEHMKQFDSNWIYDGSQESIDKIIFDLKNKNNKL